MRAWIMNYGNPDAVAFIGESPDVGRYRNALAEYGITIEAGPVREIEVNDVSEIKPRYILEYDGVKWLVLRA